MPNCQANLLKTRGLVLHPSLLSLLQSLPTPFLFLLHYWQARKLNLHSFFSLCLQRQPSLLSGWKHTSQWSSSWLLPLLLQSPICQWCWVPLPPRWAHVAYRWDWAEVNLHCPVGWNNSDFTACENPSWQGDKSIQQLSEAHFIFQHVKVPPVLPFQMFLQPWARYPRWSPSAFLHSYILTLVPMDFLELYGSTLADIWSLQESFAYLEIVGGHLCSWP